MSPEAIMEHERGANECCVIRLKGRIVAVCGIKLSRTDLTTLVWAVRRVVQNLKTRKGADFLAALQFFHLLSARDLKCIMVSSVPSDVSTVTWEL